MFGGKPRKDKVYSKERVILQLEVLDVKFIHDEGTQKINIGAKQYSIEKFQKLAKKLNEAKSKLDPIYLNEEERKKYTSFITKCLRYTQILRYHVINIMNGQLVTRAWLKFYELFLQYKLIKKLLPTDKIKVFLNAEFPGAGIAAFNHYMKTMHPNTDFDWYASSIVEGDNEVEKMGYFTDKYGIWEMNKENWIMDVEQKKNISKTPGDPNYMNDGDVTNADNLRDFEAKLKHEIDLYTHDAGIDVSTAAEGSDEPTGFNLQEIRNAKIHLGCALSGFMTLKKGGNFMAKQYTTFESISISLIMIYISLFDEFYITKLMSSGQANSEIYLVGIGFRGLPDDIRDKLLKKIEQFDLRPVVDKEDLPKGALEKLYKFTELRANEQIKYIEQNLEYYDKYGMSRLREFCKKVLWAKDKFVKTWFEKNPVFKIDPDKWIPSKKKKSEFE